MRFPIARPASLASCGLLAACLTTTACARGAAAPAPSPVAPSAEELRYLARADSLRESLLHRATWTDLGARCNPGDLRSLGDSTADGRVATDSTVERLERVIIARGVDASLDTPAGRDLLRTVVLWEAAGPRPRWDTASPKEKRYAIATGLTGQYEDPQTKRCVSYTSDDSVVVVVPTVTGLAAPRAKGAMRVSLYVGGDSAVNRARDAFYAAEGHTSNSVFTYTKLAPVVLWRDWALVVVNRPAEANGVAALGKGTGGAVYVLHRVAGEWRLLLISRSWG